MDELGYVLYAPTLSVAGLHNMSRWARAHLCVRACAKVFTWSAPARRSDIDVLIVEAARLAAIRVIMLVRMLGWVGGRMDGWVGVCVVASRKGLGSAGVSIFCRPR